VGEWLRGELIALDLQLIADVGRDAMNPAIHTFAVPGSSEKLGRRLRRAGYWCSFESGNLLAANWLQICLMGEFCEQRLSELINALRQLLAASRPVAAPELFQPEHGDAVRLTIC
jgi:aspartate aminotransferase-like enzyme